MTICVLTIYMYAYIYREREIKQTHKDAINCCECLGIHCNSCDFSISLNFFN